jgi:DNA-binding phage protein
MAINDVAEVEGIDFVAERAQMSPEEISHALQAIQSPASESILRVLKALKLNFNALHHHTSPAG